MPLSLSHTDVVLSCFVGFFLSCCIVTDTDAARDKMLFRFILLWSLQYSRHLDICDTAKETFLKGLKGNEISFRGPPTRLSVFISVVNAEYSCHFWLLTRHLMAIMYFRHDPASLPSMHYTWVLFVALAYTSEVPTLLI